MRAPGCSSYRKKPEPPPAPPAGQWPITKDQMATITWAAQRKAATDSLMDDFARCVANCEMDELEMVYLPRAVRPRILRA